MADLMTEQIKKPFAGRQGGGEKEGSERNEVRREAVRKARKARMMRTKEREAGSRWLIKENVDACGQPKRTAAV